MIQIQKINKPDMIGVAASSLCVLHCIATPIIFLASAHSGAHAADAPFWWILIDYLFLAISLAAINTTNRTSLRKWVGVALYTCWTFLLLAILNETFEVFHLPELAVYLPAFCMVGLHLYNQRYCRCTDESCCAN